MSVTVWSALILIWDFRFHLDELTVRSKFCMYPLLKISADAERTLRSQGSLLIIACAHYSYGS